MNLWYIIEIVNNNIILKESVHDFLNLKELMYIIIFDLENNVIIDEIIDVEINEKRKRENILYQYEWFWLNDEYIILIIFYFDDYDIISINAISVIIFISTLIIISQKISEKFKYKSKFHYTSKLNQIINTLIIDERIMKTMIELFI